MDACRANLRVRCATVGEGADIPDQRAESPRAQVEETWEIGSTKDMDPQGRMLVHRLDAVRPRSNLPQNLDLGSWCRWHAGGATSVRFASHQQCAVSAALATGIFASLGSTTAVGPEGGSREIQKCHQTGEKGSLVSERS